MAKPRRPAIRFGLWLAGLSVLFMWPSPALEQAYGRLFAPCARVLLSALEAESGLFRPNGLPLSGLLGTTGAVDLYADYKGDPQHDLKLGVLNFHPDRQGKKGWVIALRNSSRHLAYMPTMTLVALVLATPIPWRRKIRALAWGILCVHLFIALRFGMWVLGAFHGSETHCLFQLDQPWHDLFRLFLMVTIEIPSTTYLVPLVIWPLVSLRREDLATLAGRPEPPKANAVADPMQRRRLKRHRRRRG